MPNPYPGTTEVIPGVFIDFDEPAVYITDQRGEVVSWSWDEIREDGTAWTASLMAMLLAAKCGTHANRQVIDRDENPFDLLKK